MCTQSKKEDSGTTVYYRLKVLSPMVGTATCNSSYHQLSPYHFHIPLISGTSAVPIHLFPIFHCVPSKPFMTEKETEAEVSLM